MVNKALLRKVVVCGAPSGGMTALDAVRREVVALERLGPHPNIVSLIEVIDDPACDKLYIVMDFLPEQVSVPRRGPGHAMRGLDDGALLVVACAAAAALAHAHAHGVVHGDVKPEHLLRAPDRTGGGGGGGASCVKLVDFGSCVLFDPGAGAQADSVTRSPGTPAFTAPECCLVGRGQACYSGTKADVWALGVSLFMLRYGRGPFTAIAPAQVYEEIAAAFPGGGGGGLGAVLREAEGARDAGLRARGATERVTEALRRTLEGDPQRRPTAMEVLALLGGATPSAILRGGGGGLQAQSVEEIEEDFAKAVRAGNTRGV